MAKKKAASVGTPSSATKPKAAASPKAPARRCGLCGKKSNLMKTECCDQWICDDEHNYVMFSYSTVSCARNHERYTLCGSHFNEGHEGDWRECEKCRTGIDTEMYVYYGTNEFNFVKLENPPEFEPTRCASCSVIINLGDGGYMLSADGYFCSSCTAKRHKSRKAKSS